MDYLDKVYNDEKLEYLEEGIIGNILANKKKKQLDRIARKKSETNYLKNYDDELGQREKINRINNNYNSETKERFKRLLRSRRRVRQVEDEYMASILRRDLVTREEEKLNNKIQKRDKEIKEAELELKKRKEERNNELEKLKSHHNKELDNIKNSSDLSYIRKGLNKSKLAHKINNFGNKHFGLDKNYQFRFDNKDKKLNDTKKSIKNKIKENNKKISNTLKNARDDLNYNKLAVKINKFGREKLHLKEELELYKYYRGE